MLKIRQLSFWWKGFTFLKNKSHYRSSHRRCSERKGVLSNFAKFTGKHLCQSLFFNEVAGLRLWKERPWYRCFHVNFVKFRRTFFLQSNSGRLLLSLWGGRTFHYKLLFSLSFIILKKNPAVSQISEKDVQFFLCSVVCILNSER